MMSLLSGASRVVFVNVHVDRTWQDPNNTVLAAGVARDPNAVLVDWNTLASQNPGWLYSTATHLPINGPGAAGARRAGRREGVTPTRTRPGRDEPATVVV